MNIYDYFKSADAAEHCKSIGHRFNTIEMAWIVDQSDKTIKEKNKAFRELIESYPDMPFHESVDFRVKTSIHDYLRALIEYREQLVENFEDTTNTSRTCYCLSPYAIMVMNIDAKQYGENPAFSTIQEALDFARLHWTEKQYGRVRVLRKLSLKHKDCILVDYNYNGEAVYVFDKRNLNKKGELYKIFQNGPGDLHDLFLHIPSPFKDGDIVSVDSAPVVIKALPHTAKNYHKLVSGSKKENYPFSDRPEFAIYYYMNSKGDVRDSFPNAHMIKSPYATGIGMPTEFLEYYKEPLQDREQILLDLSEYIKENGIKDVRRWLFEKGYYLH